MFKIQVHRFFERLLLVAFAFMYSSVVRTAFSLGVDKRMSFETGVEHSLSPTCIHYYSLPPFVAAFSLALPSFGSTIIPRSSFATSVFLK